MHMRLSGEELRRDNQNSVALPEGGGYLGWMGAFHELHCIRMLREWNYRSYYHAELSAAEEDHFASHIEQAELDGFDLSLAQCPPAEWLPANIRLQKWDMFGEPGNDMLSYYDVVHLRSVITVVQEDDPRPLICNLIRLLKPGAYLQWDELDVANSFIMRAEEDTPAPVMEDMVDFLKQNGKWVGELPSYMKECGLDEAKLWQFQERKDLAKAFFDNHLAKDEEMAETAFKNTEEGQRLSNMVKKMYEESKGGVVICTPKVVCTARKPVESRLAAAIAAIA